MDNPANQFIEVAPDCETRTALVPKDNGDKRSVASIEYELLSSEPYRYTLAELKFATHVLHKQIPARQLKEQRQQLRAEFFAKPYACMRASPLTKKYGWGAHYDEQGRIAIYPVESQEYRHLSEDKHIKKYSAMRSKREG